MSFDRKALKIDEEFRAPAALYTPSSTGNKGGWAIISSPGMGGEVIIQVQDDAKVSGKTIPVVRYQLRHGQDYSNVRIVDKLPIKRVNETKVIFKSVSSSNNGIRKKTVYALKFDKKTDADKFLMWWYQLNGSIDRWVAKEIAEKSPDESLSGLVPETKQVKMEKSEAKLPSTKPTSKKTTLKEPLSESTNVKVDNRFLSSEKTYVSKKKGNEKEEEGEDEVEDEAVIDNADTPRSQNWTSAFDWN